MRSHRYSHFLTKIASGLFPVFLFTGHVIPLRSQEIAAEKAPALVLIKAGTVVGKEPPAGWSGIIVKSKPRLESGDIDTLPSVGIATASLFRTVMLADVRAVPNTPSKFVLRRIGLGLCVPVKGRDTVVTDENASTPPISLGYLQSQVFTRADEEMKKGRLVCQTPTFAIVASPSELKVGKEHRRIFLIYAMLVDPTKGHLDTLVWSITADPRFRSPVNRLDLLPAGMIEDCGVDVVAERLLGTIPINWSFAMCSTPRGRPIQVPRNLQALLVDLKQLESHPIALERSLRSLLSNPKETPNDAVTTRP